MQSTNDTNTSPDILDYLQVPNDASQGDLLAYIARTRRQLDRFEHLPEGNAQKIEPGKAARIRVMCDELEADIRAGLVTA